jgi:hypothetical protein
LVKGSSEDFCPLHLGGGHVFGVHRSLDMVLLTSQ